MKTRIISATVAIAIGVCAFLLIFTPFFSLFVAFLSAMAAYEIMHVAKIKSKLILIPAVAFSAIMPNYIAYKSSLPFEVPISAVLSVYAIALMIFMLKSHKSMKFEQLAIALYASVFVPYAFSCTVILRDLYITYDGTYTKAESVYLVLYALFCAFITDTFAYFVGRKFGKHKLCPEISPKKTVEGAVGGLVLSAVFNVLVFVGVRAWIFGEKSAISIWFIAVMSVLLSAISMFGDLSASLLKRNFGVKDFGKIMPGHGGIMDRFDSYIFVVTVLSAAVKFIN